MDQLWVLLALLQGAGEIDETFGIRWISDCERRCERCAQRGDPENRSCRCGISGCCSRRIGLDKLSFVCLEALLVALRSGTSMVVCHCEIAGVTCAKGQRRRATWACSEPSRPPVRLGLSRLIVMRQSWQGLFDLAVGDAISSIPTVVCNV